MWLQVYPIYPFYTHWRKPLPIFLLNYLNALVFPLIALSIIVTLSSYGSSNMYKVFHRTAFYTLSTTIIAAMVSCILYVLIQPSNIHSPDTIVTSASHTINYWQYLTTLIPSNFLTPFLENQVISVLIIGITIGTAIRFIPDQAAKLTIIHFFKGLHTLLFIITKWIVANHCNNCCHW